MEKKTEILCITNDYKKALKTKTSIGVVLGSTSVRVIDISGNPKGKEVLETFVKVDPFLSVEYREGNYNENLDYGIRTSKYKNVFVIRGGIKIRHPDVIMSMSRYIASRVYAVGQIILVNDIPVIDPSCMLVNKKIYMRWPPYSLKTMAAINRAGMTGKLLIHIRNLQEFVA